MTILSNGSCSNCGHKTHDDDGCKYCEVHQLRYKINDIMDECERLNGDNVALLETEIGDLLTRAENAEEEVERGFASDMDNANLLNEIESLKATIIRYDKAQTEALERAEKAEAENKMLKNECSDCDKLDEIKAERDRLLTIAIRERTWRLEQEGCGGDEVNESVDKLKYEALNPSTGDKP